MEPRLADVDGVLSSFERAASKFLGKRDDQRRIAVAHIGPGPLLVAAGDLLQLVLGRYGPIFSLAAGRAPSAVLDAVGDSPVQGGAVDAGLAAGDDSFDHCGIVRTPFFPPFPPHSRHDTGRRRRYDAATSSAKTTA